MVHRRPIALAAVAIASLTMAGSALRSAQANPQRAARPATTSVRTISPVDPAGHLVAAYRVRHRYADASCQSGSSYTGSAYRCAARQSPQGILDPCWIQSNPAHVICLTKPWLHQVDRLHVTGRYDNRTGLRPTHQPWGMRLPHQTECLFNAGGVVSAHGHAITYHCPKKTALVGPLQRGRSSWRIRAYQKRGTKGHRHFVPLGWQHVQVAWFGRPSRPAP